MRWAVANGDNPLVVSVLFNEPKLLKSKNGKVSNLYKTRFSALQRAEIAEIGINVKDVMGGASFSALQRAEIAEIEVRAKDFSPALGFQCSSTSRNC